MRATTLDEPEFRERVVLDALARTLLPLADDVAAAVRAARQLLGWKPERWFRTLVANVLAWPEMRAGQMTAGELAARLSGIPSLMEAIDEGEGVVLDLSAIPRPRMRRSPVAGMGPIVRLETVGDCLDWLGLGLNELDWLTDPKGWLPAAGQSRLAHYHCQWIPKPAGGVRLIEAPKRRLKAIQRKIHEEILRHVPPHEAAHAYRPGRSMVTALTPHTGQETVWHLDLTSFFWSIGSGRVRRFFRRIGYPEGVAGVLTGLCTSRVAPGLLEAAPLSEREKQQLLARHLPQGAPTSPALSNLCAFRLDCRLSALSARYDVRYTRYADDLVFSCGPKLRRRLPGFRNTVLTILIDEGFQIRRRKTRVLRRGQRQQVGGLILNETLNVPRVEYDTLRAILHDCGRNGPTVANRDQHPSFREHLQGRVAWIAHVSPGRGRKLKEMFERIDWSGSEEPTGAG